MLRWRRVCPSSLTYISPWSVTARQPSSDSHDRHGRCRMFLRESKGQGRAGIKACVWKAVLYPPSGDLFMRWMSL
jgi:hypothetical protein